MKLESIPQVIDFDPYGQSVTAQHGLGEEIRLADGRIFRYAKAGSSGQSKGKLQLAVAPNTSLHNLAVAATAIGATNVTVTPGATTAGAGTFDEGYMVVNDNYGEGQTYKIKHNPAIASATAFSLDLFDPINVALTTTSEVSLYHNAYNAVVEDAAAYTRQPAGVPLVTLAASYYGWLQTRGVAAVLCGTTGTVGALGMCDGSTAGAVTDMTDVTAPEAEYWVGRFVVAGVSTEYRPFFLMID